jgi:hypothetical protein
VSWHHDEIIVCISNTARILDKDLGSRKTANAKRGKESAGNPSHHIAAHCITSTTPSTSAAVVHSLFVPFGSRVEGLFVNFFKLHIGHLGYDQVARENKWTKEQVVMMM